MARRICILQGHPDPDEGHFCHALAEAYAAGARAAGHSVTRLSVAALAPEPLQDAAEFDRPAEGAMHDAQAAVMAADHLVVVFPLWLGSMPARLKAFFEQFARGKAVLDVSAEGWPVGKLKGRSARVIVTMGMPALAYRLWFLNAGVAVLKRLILGLGGVRPVRQTTIGGVGEIDAAAGARWLARVEALGRAGR